MLSVSDPDGSAVARQAFLYSLALLPVGIAPAFFGMAHLAYAVIATLASTALLAWSIPQ